MEPALHTRDHRPRRMDPALLGHRVRGRSTPTSTQGQIVKAGLYAPTVECDGALCIVAEGELDLATAQILDDALLAAEASDAPEIVLDIDAVSFIDSTGLRTLLQACRRSQRNGNRLRLTRGTAQAQRLFALVAADKYLPFINA